MAAHTLPGLGLSGNFVDGQDNWGELMDANLERLTIAVNTRVLGTVANSGALPAEPADGDSYIQLSDNHIRSYDEADDEWMDTTPQNGWRLFREDTLEFYNFIDGAWVAEDSGPSLPAGGTTGQVLAKASDDDGDAEWIDAEAASLPAGTPGQVLVKTADGAEFQDFDGLPEGGDEGQVIVLGPDGPEWADPEAAVEGGVWAVVNTTTGAMLAGGGCVVVRDTGSRYTVTFDEERPDADYGVLFGGTSGGGGTQPFVVDDSQTTAGFAIICYDAGGGEATPNKLMFQLAGLLPGSEDSGLPPGGTTGQVLTKTADSAEWADPAKPTESIIIAASDETTALTAGTSKVTFRMPYAFTLTAVRASLSTASSVDTVTVDINEGGASVLGTKLSIDAGEKTSTTAASAATITDASLADDAEITVDVDAAGTGATGLKITLIGRRQ